MRTTSTTVPARALVVAAFAGLMAPCALAQDVGQDVDQSSDTDDAAERAPARAIETCSAGEPTTDRGLPDRDADGIADAIDTRFRLNCRGSGAQ